MSRRAHWTALLLALIAGSGIPAGSRATGEGVTGLPADVTPMLTLAGIWQGVADEHTTPLNHGGISNFYSANLRLHNGREGIVIGSWSFAGFANTDATVIPVSIALLEQQSDGTMQVATSRYVSNPLTNGISSVVVADFNRDGVDDFVMPAWNEAPNIRADSVAFLSSRDRYDRIVIPDDILAHGSTVAEIDGKPTVFTATYNNFAPNRSSTVMQFDGTNGFTMFPETGVGASSSVAVADFDGRGEYAIAFGDFSFGPGYRFEANKPKPVYLYRLSNLRPAGAGVTVAAPYFDGKAQYEQYQSFWDPLKTHTIRLFADDFNQDGKVDLVAESILWHPAGGTPKNVLQMLQHDGGYAFRDVTGDLNPEYSEDCFQSEYHPQLRTVDDSPIKTYFIGSASFNTAQPACNYVLVNDGTGRLRVALHETLNTYSDQILRWVATNSQLPSGYFVQNPAALRAYRTPNGKVNFLAMLYATYRPSPSSDYVFRRVFVNVPLQLDLPAQFTAPIVVENRNRSRHVRTFAGDDDIRAGEVSGAIIDGGRGTNTVRYPGSRLQYTVTQDGDRQMVTAAETGVADTLIHIQRVVFSDAVVLSRRPD